MICYLLHNCVLNSKKIMKNKRHKALEKYLEMPVLKEHVSDIWEMKETIANCDRTTIEKLCLQSYAMQLVSERYIEELECKIIENA